MPVPRMFTTKPVIVEAVQWDGTPGEADAVIDWIYSYGKQTARFHEARPGVTLQGETIEVPNRIAITDGGETPPLMIVFPDDWVVLGPDGEFSPCNPDVFKATYERR